MNRFLEANGALNKRCKFEKLLSLIREYMQNHYDKVIEWRQGVSPSKKQRKETCDHHEKIGKFVAYLEKLQSRKRGKQECNKHIAKKTLLKVTEIFDC